MELHRSRKCQIYPDLPLLLPWLHEGWGDSDCGVLSVRLGGEDGSRDLAGLTDRYPKAV